MKKKVLITTISVLVITIIACGFWYIFHLNKNPETLAGKNVSKDFDYAALNVFGENLMKNASVSFDGVELNINGTYFDGIRLYLRLSTNNLNLTKDSVDNFHLTDTEKIFTPDLLILYDDMKIVTGEMDCLLIFNSFEEINISTLVLSYDNSKTNRFSVEYNATWRINFNVYLEGMKLNYVEFGKTSTLLNCDIIANIEGVYFQIELENTILPVYVINKNGTNYKLLLPVELDENSKINLISNNESNVELKIPIDFTKLPQSKLSQ